MEQLKLIECDKCKSRFSAKDIELYPKIVRKENLRAIAYCFKCPECGQEYVCYFKDSTVNELFRKGDTENARMRMNCLREIFTNDHPI